MPAIRKTNATLQTVAEKAGVSKTTVASILRNEPGFRISDETRQRVLEASRLLGYQRNAVATSLSLGRTQTVGLLLPLHHLPTENAMFNIYGQNIFISVFKAASRANLRVIPIPLPANADEPLSTQMVNDRRIDGLVLASVRDAAFVQSIHDAEIPCVEIGSGSGRYLIHPDNEGGVDKAISHLVDLGHRRILHWYGGPGGFASEHRLSGFLHAAERYGLEDAPFVIGPEEVEKQLRRPKGEHPTAVFTFCDYFATVVLDIAHKIGLRVPEDLSIVGFDNCVLAEAARPALTTVHNPLDEQSDGAIEMLQMLWRGEEPPARRMVPVRLVVRGSTARPAP